MHCIVLELLCVCIYIYIYIYIQGVICEKNREGGVLLKTFK